MKSVSGPTRPDTVWLHCISGSQSIWLADDGAVLRSLDSHRFETFYASTSSIQPRAALTSTCSHMQTPSPIHPALLPPAAGQTPTLRARSTPVMERVYRRPPWPVPPQTPAHLSSWVIIIISHASMFYRMFCVLLPENQRSERRRDKKSSHVKNERSHMSGRERSEGQIIKYMTNAPALFHLQCEMHQIHIQQKLMNTITIKRQTRKPRAVLLEADTRGHYELLVQ